MVKIAILGYGTVGSGVFEVFRANRESIAKKAGQEIEVKYVLDLREFPGDPVEEVLVHDFAQIENDPEVSVVVETMGGLKPAYDFSKAALAAGKSVCTSNKELVAEHGTELMRIAREHGANYLFEASCGGGIPVIRAMNSSLTADVITEVAGILNGTTNFILTKMAREGSDFDTVLAEAQSLGYAERNPEADVEGHDARRKIAILSSVAYGQYVNHEKVHAEGITKITPEDHAYAKALGYSIKLLGVSRREEDSVCAYVVPVMVGGEDPLYNVNDVFNGIFVKGNMLGDAMFYGSGAGKLPTASAVAADVVDCVVHAGRDVMAAWSEEELAVTEFGKVRNRFFVRVPDNAKQAVHENFGERKETGGIAAETMAELRLDGIPGEFAFVTDEMTEEEFAEKVRNVGALSYIRMRM